MSNPFRSLPSVSELERRAAEAIGEPIDPSALVRLIRSALERERAAIERGEVRTREQIVEQVVAEFSAMRTPRLRPVINATGVLIHTNLGRSPVSPETADAMARTASGYVSLEIEPETNARGGRMAEISRLMFALTGAEATLIVNNGAAAILLALSALAQGRDVVVSRGEAVEIGGGFRIPDVMTQSGCRLVEIGTTNRTHLRDYAAAIGNETAALLKVHPSNFQISGFTASVTVAELGPLAEERGVALIEDLGSGALLDTGRWGLASEPTIGESLGAGATVITASGDKLLGGPQAGIIAGRKDVIAIIAGHPLARAVRADKTTLAGIAATLRHYLRGEAEQVIPVWRMITATPAAITSRAESIAAILAQRGIAVELRACTSPIGGGSLPGKMLPSVALVVDGQVDAIARRLRLGAPAVFPRVEDGRVWLDLRTVLSEQDEELTAALTDAVRA